MGSSHYYVYLGPYVECTFKPMTRTVQQMRCPKEGCTKRGFASNAKFCDTCGSEIASVPVEVPTHPDAEEITKEALSSMNMGTEEGTWLVPNVHRKGQPERPNHLDDEVHLDLRNVSMAVEMKWFEEAFAKELAALRPHYASVEIKWGLHQYYL